jgi:transcriptional regulator with XRE-family HTH domain
MVSGGAVTDEPQVIGRRHDEAMDRRFGLGVRALRVRASLRQSDVGREARVSRSLVAKLEGGDIDGVTVGRLRAVADALGAIVDVRLRWRGESLDRLMDEAHARLVEAFVLLLRALGWEVALEVSFSVWGERGSIDVFAWHPPTGIVLVVEVKSVVPDSQATLHGLDRKTRLAEQLARERGWAPRGVARLLVVGESATSRRRIARLAATYATALPMRGWAVRRWLQHPSGGMAGLLFLSSATPGDPNGGSAGRERVRRPNRRSEAA